ncbi:MAG: His/Gly/Thr/Pro-type tRNA ligase C-terminal domain-containing protein, partial [Clostridium sp.]
EINKPEGVKIFIAALGDEAKTYASKLAQDLRLEGISCERDLLSRSLKAQMKYANKLGAKYSIVLGENELKENKASLKNMETSESVDITLSDLVTIMKDK